MISEKFGCLFVHIPKAAGQSVENFFLRLHGLTWEERAPLLLRYNPDPARGPEALAHLTAQEYIDLGYVKGEQDFRRYFSFSFVRNPWDRLVSEYRYRQRGRPSGRTFKEFVRDAFGRKSNYSDRYRHLIPQSDFLYDRQGRLLVEFVGRFETLQRDFDVVCGRLGIAPSQLPQVNISPPVESPLARVQDRESPPYVPYYDGKLERFVADFYAVDIERFGYRFGG